MSNPFVGFSNVDVFNVTSNPYNPFYESPQTRGLSSNHANVNTSTEATIFTPNTNIGNGNYGNQLDILRVTIDDSELPPEHSISSSGPFALNFPQSVHQIYCLDRFQVQKYNDIQFTVCMNQNGMLVFPPPIQCVGISINVHIHTHWHSTVAFFASSPFSRDNEPMIAASIKCGMNASNSTNIYYTLNSYNETVSKLVCNSFTNQPNTDVTSTGTYYRGTLLFSSNGTNWIVRGTLQNPITSTLNNQPFPVISPTISSVSSITSSSSSPITTTTSNGSVTIGLSLGATTGLTTVTDSNNSQLVDLALSSTLYSTGSETTHIFPYSMQYNAYGQIVSMTDIASGPFTVPNLGNSVYTALSCSKGSLVYDSTYNCLLVNTGDSINSTWTRLATKFDTFNSLIVGTLPSTPVITNSQVITANPSSNNNKATWTSYATGNSYPTFIISPSTNHTGSTFYFDCYPDTSGVLYASAPKVVGTITCNPSGSVFSFNVSAYAAAQAGVTVTTDQSCLNVTTSGITTPAASITNDTDASSSGAGSITTAGGIYMVKGVYVGTTANVNSKLNIGILPSTPTFTSSRAVIITSSGNAHLTAYTGDDYPGFIIQPLSTGHTGTTFYFDCYPSTSSVLNASAITSKASTFAFSNSAFTLNITSSNAVHVADAITVTPYLAVGTSGISSTSLTLSDTTIASYSNVSFGSICTQGGIYAASNLYIASSTDANSTTGSIFTNGGAFVTLGSYVGGISILNGTTSMNAFTDGSISSSGVFSGALAVSGGIALGSNMVTQGWLNVKNTTDASSSKGGSIVTSGGLKIALTTLLNMSLNVVSNCYIGSLASPNSNANMQADSNTKGFLPPRISAVSKYGMSQTIPAGLVVYDTFSNQICVFDGNKWNAITVCPSPYVTLYSGPTKFSANTGLGFMQIPLGIQNIDAYEKIVISCNYYFVTDTCHGLSLLYKSTGSLYTILNKFTGSMDPVTTAGATGNIEITIYGCSVSSTSFANKTCKRSIIVSGVYTQAGGIGATEISAQANIDSNINIELFMLNDSSTNNDNAHINGVWKIYTYS